MMWALLMFFFFLVAVCSWTFYEMRRYKKLSERQEAERERILREIRRQM